MLHFAVVTDIHYGFDAANKKGSKAPTLIDRFVRVANKYKVDFTLDLGDRVIRARDPGKRADFPDQAAQDRHYLGRLKDQFNALAAPHYQVDGNHDINLPRTPSQLVELEGLSLIVWNPHLVMGPRGFDVKPEDMDWLKEALRSAKGPCILAGHIPLDNNPADNKKALERDKKPYYSFYPQAAEIRALLEQSGKVVASLNGHAHRNRKREINGIQYLTLQSLVQKSKKSGHAIGAFYRMSFDGSSLDVKAYGRGQKSFAVPQRSVQPPSAPGP